MAIAFINSSEIGTTNGGSPSLTMPASLAAGDIVVVWGGFCSDSNQDPGISSGGWTENSDLYGNGSGSVADTNASLNYKIMGSTPDSSATCLGNGSAASAVAYVASAYRGVDTGTPLDAATVASATADGNQPNSASITTVTDQAWVLSCGMTTHISGADETVTAGANITQRVAEGANDDADVTVAIGDTNGGQSIGAFDPAAWTGFSSDAAGSRAQATLALRPIFEARLIMPPMAPPMKKCV